MILPGESTWAEHGVAKDLVRHVNAAIKEDGAQQRLKAVGHRVPAEYNRVQYS